MLRPLKRFKICCNPASARAFRTPGVLLSSPPPVAGHLTQSLTQYCLTHVTDTVLLLLCYCCALLCITAVCRILQMPTRRPSIYMCVMFTLLRAQFNLTADPTESNNLYSDPVHQAIVYRLKMRLQELGAAAPPWAAVPEVAQMSGAQLDKAKCDAAKRFGALAPIDI